MGLFNVERLEAFDRAACPGPNRPIVMIVDDEELNRSAMADALRDSFEVMEAKDGASAWTQICSTPNIADIACIISDQRMPKMTGLTLLAKMRVSFPKIVRVIITAYADMDLILKAVNDTDIYKFIVKPIDLNDFILTIRRAVQAFEMQRDLDQHHERLEEMVHLRTAQLAEKSQELERVMQILRNNRAKPALLPSRTEETKARYCAIIKDSGEICYAEQGFDKLLKQEWPLSGPSQTPPQLMSFLDSDEGSCKLATIVIHKHWVDGMWLVRARARLPIDILTDRELEVVDLLAQGMSYKEIARDLNIAPATVRSHLQRLHEKLDVKTNAGLVKKCTV